MQDQSLSADKPLLRFTFQLFEEPEVVTEIGVCGPTGMGED